MSKDRKAAAARIAIPVYVRRGVADYVAENPGTSFARVVVDGLAQLGIETDPEDLPRRCKATKVDLADYGDQDTIGVTFNLPAYVRQRVARYELAHHLTLKQVVLQGFAKLGINVAPADLAGPDYSQNARGRSAPAVA